MNCSRCQGLMIVDHFLDFGGSFSEMWTTGWRCVNCGHIHDALIEQNRMARQEKVVTLRSVAPDYQDDEVHLGAEGFVKYAA